jgi:hypothetical protein
MVSKDIGKGTLLDIGVEKNDEKLGDQSRVGRGDRMVGELGVVHVSERSSPG